ncbi:hypothetical protein [Helicobacter pylori]|uniref:hypothetical protein n=1 Tax=Helicobacter pylori TaxID=210 RepID=UPI000EB44E36|nr:hypothetical protein [Helicobacter pylori]
MNSMIKQPYDEFNVFYNGDDKAPFERFINVFYKGDDKAPFERFINVFYKGDDKAPFERFIRRIKIKTLQK